MSNPRFRQFMHAVGEWLRRVVTQPRSELTRWQRAARFAYDLGRFGARQLRQDNAPQMAGALAFRTLFGLIPVFVVGTVLMRAFRGIDQLSEWVRDMCSRLGLDDVSVTIGADGAKDTLSEWVVAEFLQPIQQLNFAALGWVGLAVLIYSSIGLMVTIENSFNTIYRAPTGRSWARRVPVYWTVLTLGPLFLGLTDYLYARSLSVLIDPDNSWQWALSTVPFIWRFVVMWIFLIAVYKLIPNTRVALQPAITGAFVTAVLFEIGRQSLGAYLGNMMSIQYLYSSLGLIPLFMFWVYVMWLVVLFGLEVSSTLQNLRGRRLDEMEAKGETSGLVDPAAVVLVMEIITGDFAAGRLSTAQSVAEDVGLPERIVARMLQRLAEAGLLRRLAEDEQAFALARPAEQISPRRLLEIGFEMMEAGREGRHSDLIRRLRAAQRSLAGQLTLVPRTD